MTAAQEKNLAFWQFLKDVREAIEINNACARAFWYAIWKGEEGLAKLGPNPTDEQLFAYEFGLQLKPAWAEIDAQVRQAIIGAIVAMLLGAVGLGARPKEK